jgi:hypothetical protein
MAWPARGALIALMRTQIPDEARERRVQSQDRRQQPAIERRAASVAPKIKASLRAAEWRPGDVAKRGYEKAVEDWWWL